MRPTRIVLEQMRWERDVAISQLNEIGVDLGADMSDIKKALEKIQKIKEYLEPLRNYNTQNEHLEKLKELTR